MNATNTYSIEFTNIKFISAVSSESTVSVDQGGTPDMLHISSPSKSKSSASFSLNYIVSNITKLPAVTVENNTANFTAPISEFTYSFNLTTISNSRIKGVLNEFSLNFTNTFTVNPEIKDANLTKVITGLLKTMTPHIVSEALLGDKSFSLMNQAKKSLVALIPPFFQLLTS